MISTVILIHAEFDVARGCKALRAYVNAQNWKPALAARATAALTAMGELILCSSADQLVPVNVSVNRAGRDSGIELTCNLYLPEVYGPKVKEAVERLERAADHLDIYETAGNVQITACLHVR